MLHHVRHIHLAAIDPCFFKSAVHDLSCGSNKRFPSDVFVISRLFANQHDRCAPGSFAKYGFEPLVTLTSITPRVLCCVATISYDKCDAEQTRQAAACYKELYEICTREGYLPYRCGMGMYTGQLSITA